MWKGEGVFIWVEGELLTGRRREGPTPFRVWGGTEITLAGPMLARLPASPPNLVCLYHGVPLN
jgi:hypothetical protein